MSGSNETRLDEQAPGNPGRPAPNSGSVRLTSRGVRRELYKTVVQVSPRDHFPHSLIRRQARIKNAWKTSFANLEVVLMEGNPLDTHSDAEIAGVAMECRMGEALVGAGLLSGPPATPLTVPRGAGDAVHSDWPGAWENSTDPTGWRSVGDPTPRHRRAPAVPQASPHDGAYDVAELKGSPQPARKTALQMERFTKPSQLSSAVNFEDAYQMYNRRVYAKCLRMVGNEAEAEDLTQDIFLQVFRKMDSFRGESAFSTWLYRVAVNMVLASRRRKSLITSSLEEVTELKEGISNLHQLLGAPDRVLTAAIDRLSLECVFSRMPAGYRQVFLMHYVEGYEHREIARILGLSTGTSKSQLYKARGWLREQLCAGESKQRRTRVSSRPRRVPLAGRRSKRSRHSSFAGSCG